MPHIAARGMFKDVLLVARGTVLGQLPFVAVTPLIARLYPAAELGVYGLSMAYVGIVAPVAGLRFDLAAISSRDRTDAQALLLLSVLSVFPVAAASTGVLYFLKYLGWGSYDALPGWLVIATGIIIVASGAYSSLRSWLVRRHRFRLVANSLTLLGCVRAVIPVALVPLGASAALLIAAELFARLSAVGQMVRSGALFPSLRLTRLPLGALLERARRFWKYPLLLGPSGLVDAASTALPVPILASCYGLAAAGKFALVQRLVLLPAALIVSSAGDVFHAHAARLAGEREGGVTQFLTRTAGKLLLLGIMVYAPMALLAPFVAGWVFGARWADAGPMIALLTPLCIAQTIVSPLSRGLLLSGREERKLLADALSLTLTVASLYLASRWSLLVAIGCYSTAAVVANALYFMVIVQALQHGTLTRTEEQSS